MASSDFEDEGLEQQTRRSKCAPRTLMRWDVEKDQLLLLCVDHVCTENGVQIPWDKVGELLTPNVTGEAIKQHLGKVRAYRIQNNQQVPPKSDKSTRRKISVVADGDRTTPLKGSRAKKAKKEEHDEEEEATPKKGLSLLYIKPEKKAKAAKIEKDTSTPATARRGGGRKKASGDGGSGASIGDTTTSTGKRGRKKQAMKDENIKKEEGEDSEYDSPTKKPKTRAKPKVNYCEDPLIEDEEEEVARYDGQNGDGTSTYEQGDGSFQHSKVSMPLDYSQTSTLGELPTHPYQSPDYFGAVGAQCVGPVHGAFGGPRMQYEAGIIQAATNTYHPFDNFGNYHGLPPNVANSYSGYYKLPPCFGGESTDPYCEQDLRDAIDSTLPAIQGETTTQSSAPDKTPRKKAARKTENTQETKIKKTTAVSTPKPATDTAASIKIETPATMTSGYWHGNMIPATNSSGYACGPLSMGINPRGIGGIEQTAYDFNPSINIHANTAPMTPVASPVDFFDYNTAIAHTGVTPSMNSMSFDNAYSMQFSNTPSHSSSFDSIHLTQSNEALPRIEQADSMNFNVHGWDPSAYEMCLPGDEFADVGL